MAGNEVVRVFSIESGCNCLIIDNLFDYLGITLIMIGDDHTKVA